MSEISFTETIKRINENQYDMVELITNWKDLILGDSTTDITFDFFNGTTAVFPSLAKLQAQWGAGTTTPTANALALRDSSANLYANKFIHSGTINSIAYESYFELNNLFLTTTSGNVYSSLTNQNLIFKIPSAYMVNPRYMKYNGTGFSINSGDESSSFDSNDNSIFTLNNLIFRNFNSSSHERRIDLTHQGLTTSYDPGEDGNVSSTVTNESEFKASKVSKYTNTGTSTIQTETSTSEFGFLDDANYPSLILHQINPSYYGTLNYKTTLSPYSLKFEQLASHGPSSTAKNSIEYSNIGIKVGGTSQAVAPVYLSSGYTKCVITYVGTLNVLGVFGSSNTSPYNYTTTNGTFITSLSGGTVELNAESSSSSYLTYAMLSGDYEITSMVYS